jgi:hypothetical protein
MNKHDFLASLWEELDLPFDVEDVQEIEAVLDNNAVYIDLADGRTFLLSITGTYSPNPTLNEIE